MNDVVLADKPTGGSLSSRARRGGVAGSTALVVLGMHRSGTSALTGMLHHLGIALGDRLMPASPHAPRAYWEHTGIVGVNERLMAAFGWAWDEIRSLPDDFERS